MSVEVSVRTMDGERAMSHWSSRPEEEDMWAFVPLAPLPVVRTNVPLSTVQPSVSASKLKVRDATSSRSLSLCWIVRSVVRVSGSSSSAVTSTRIWVEPSNTRPCAWIWKTPSATVQVARSAATVAGRGVMTVVKGCVIGVIPMIRTFVRSIAPLLLIGNVMRRDLAVVEERIVVAARQPEAVEDREVRPFDRRLGLAGRERSDAGVRRADRGDGVRVVASVLEARVEERELVRLRRR